MRTRVKICGITRAEDARAAVRLGADALGFILWRGSARFVDPAAAAAIARDVGPFVTTVGVFVNPGADEVRAAIAAGGLGMLQFHGDEPADFCRAFGLPYIKAFSLEKSGLEKGEGGDLLKLLAGYESAAGWMFDAHDDQLVGGTGRTFDWSRLPDGLARPLVLSGGLNAGNVAAAIRLLRPFAVDVSSGVETSGTGNKGIKDAVKIAAFMQGVRDAGQ
jgi:phosphoribosylanthranilate isomerase